MLIQKTPGKKFPGVFLSYFLSFSYLSFKEGGKDETDMH